MNFALTNCIRVIKSQLNIFIARTRNTKQNIYWNFPQVKNYAVSKIKSPKNSPKAVLFNFLSLHICEKKGIDSKTFLLEIYKANIEINLSFNQSFSNIAKISRLNLFCRLNVILLDKNNGPKKHKKNSLIV